MFSCSRVNDSGHHSAELQCRPHWRGQMVVVPMIPATRSFCPLLARKINNRGEHRIYHFLLSLPKLTSAWVTRQEYSGHFCCSKNSATVRMGNTLLHKRKEDNGVTPDSGIQTSRPHSPKQVPARIRFQAVSHFNAGETFIFFTLEVRNHGHWKV